MEYSALTINLLAAFLIAILSLVIANILGNILKKFLKGTELNAMLEKKLKLKIPLEETIVRLTKYTIYLIGAIAILGQLEIPSRIIKIVFITVIIALLAFTLLSLKDILPNIASGIYIRKTKKIKTGETIKIRGIEGRVTAINLLETEIETKGKEKVFVPNTILTKEEVTRI